MKLEGLSVAGIETCIEVPELRLVLDMGRCTRAAVQQPVVLVSHGHLDHIGAIAQHAARRAMMSMSEGTYLVPAGVARLAEGCDLAGDQRAPRAAIPLYRRACTLPPGAPHACLKLVHAEEALGAPAPQIAADYTRACDLLASEACAWLAAQ